MKAVAILSPQRQVAGKGALPRLSPALCGGRCQVWGGGPPAPKRKSRHLGRRAGARRSGRGSSTRTRLPGRRQKALWRGKRPAVRGDGGLERGSGRGRGGQRPPPSSPVPPFRGRLLGRLREGAWRRKHCSDASSATFTASQVCSVAIKAKENVLFYDFL